MGLMNANEEFLRRQWDFGQQQQQHAGSANQSSYNLRQALETQQAAQSAMNREQFERVLREQAHFKQQDYEFEIAKIKAKAQQDLALGKCKDPKKEPPPMW